MTGYCLGYGNLTINVPVVSGAGCKDFDAAISITRAGGALKIETFWALKWQRAKKCHLDPKKC